MTLPSLTPPASLALPDATADAAQARFWDRAAPKYAASKIADPAGYEATLDRVRSLLTPAHEVLEVGCGTGSTALRLAPGVRHWTATDVSPEMIAIARRKLAAASVPQLRFDVGTASRPPMRAASLDAVLAFNVLHLVPDLDATIAALAQTLKRGGLFISKTACLAEMHPLVTRVAVPLMRAVGKAPPLLHFDAAQLQAAFERQGLAVDAVERHGSKRRDWRVFIVARKSP